MNINRKFFPTLIAVLYLGTADIFTTPAIADSLSPDVRQALDTVYLAAKDADMINPTGENKTSSSDNVSISKSELPAKTSSRDPYTQMLAMGLGAAAGMLAVNLVSGGTTTYGSTYGFYSLMFGGMLGDYAYRTYYAPPLPSVPASITQRVSP